jgi:hypothetical protein
LNFWSRALFFEGDINVSKNLRILLNNDPTLPRLNPVRHILRETLLSPQNMAHRGKIFEIPLNLDKLINTAMKLLASIANETETLQFLLKYGARLLKIQVIP